MNKCLSSTHTRACTNRLGAHSCAPHTCYPWLPYACARLPHLLRARLVQWARPECLFHFLLHHRSKTEHTRGVHRPSGPPGLHVITMHMLRMRHAPMRAHTFYSFLISMFSFVTSDCKNWAHGLSCMWPVRKNGVIEAQFLSRMTCYVCAMDEWPCVRHDRHLL